MSFGTPERGDHPWTLDEAASRPLIRQAVEAGINFFDTANAYSDGSSEEIVGRALKDFARRDEIVVATKVRFASRRAPNVGGLSRKAILHEIDASLKRLDMDHVDLYQIHRWDPHTPIEETMQALHDLVRAGKVRYLGASSMHAWQFAKAQQVARENHLTPFISMQPELSLLYREEEREMLPLCLDQGVGVIPWSPLARGRLARPWGEHTPRIGSDKFGATLFAHSQDNDRSVVEALGALAAQRGVPRAQLALAWVLRQPAVAAPIVGATRSAHLDDALASLQLKLNDDEVAALEAPYLPHAPVGFPVGAGRRSALQPAVGAHHGAQRAQAVDAVQQPAAPRQQRDRSHRDGDLQHRGGLRPAVVLVQLVRALLVEGNRLFLELFGLRLVGVHAGFELARTRVVHAALVGGRDVHRQFVQRLLGTVRLELGPLDRRFRFADRGIVLRQRRRRLRGPAHVRVDRADGGQDGRGHRQPPGKAVGLVVRSVFERVVVRPVDVEAFGHVRACCLAAVQRALRR